jgi:multiple sugar transport system permease protein
MNPERGYTSVISYIKGVFWGRTFQKSKQIILGQQWNDGWLAKLAIYFLLSIVAYLYLQPMLYMMSTMLKTLSDLLDPSVKWIPRDVTWENLQKAWIGLKYPQALSNTFMIAVFCSSAQVIVCAMTGYALARLPMPGKNFLFFLVLLTFLIPPQIVTIPLYVIFSKLGWLNTIFVFLIPAIFGQGLKSALFILIFMRFFKSQPASLEEAAMLDGASIIRLFFRIMLPLASSACLVVFLFSFVWYWNMYYEPMMYLANHFTPLSIRLSRLEEVLNPSLGLSQNLGTKNPITESVKMAAAFLIILPPLILYMFLQRWFVEGIERTGMVD